VISAAGQARYLVIDDLGVEHPWPSATIFREFEGLRADCDPLAYAVRNLGFVLILDRPGFVRLRLRPLLVSSRSIALAGGTPAFAQRDRLVRRHLA
jgi:hypothetical protein